MVARYPHTITIRYFAAPTQDANGNLIEGLATELVSECRISQGGGSWKTGENGTYTDIVYTVSLPLLTDKTFTNGEVVIEGKNYSIKNIHHYQQRTKIWV